MADNIGKRSREAEKTLHYVCIYAVGSIKTSSKVG